MRRLALLLFFACCTPARPATYPDHGKVDKAQAGWCKMLAKLDAPEGDVWRHQAECDAGSPSASAPFLAKLTSCYEEQMEGRGDDAPDSQVVIEGCTQQILGDADPGDVKGTDLYKARCARQSRCQKVSAAVCDSAWEQIDGMTRAILTSMYNLGAQAEIAACLDDGECSEDDATAQDACYQTVKDKLVWLPLSLGHDPTLDPKVD
jgi:hypothetical protein